MAFIVRWGCALLAAWLTLSATAGYAKPPKPPSSVADLRFGVALYDYYQNQPLEALSELMVAEARGGIQGQGENPAIMAGGFYMAYGMERAANEIFTRVLDNNRPQKVRDAAWFYLAQMHYNRGDWAGTETALTRVSAEPDADLAQDILALRCNILTRRDDIDGAAKLVRAADPESSWLPYLYYNLGAAYGRAGQFKKAVETYNALLSMYRPAPDFLALHDKAMTSAGYGYLLNKQYDQAISQFSRVRLNSPVSGRALLGYGWAAAENGNYAQALAPWQALSHHSLIDESVQESFIAIPYAYEKLKRPSEALDAYRNAEKTYVQAVTSLNNTLQGLESDSILEMLKADPNEDVNWLGYAASNHLAPQKVYLAQLFSQELFQREVKTLRDLMAIQRSLVSWQERLGTYQAMLNEREINRRQHLANYNQHNYSAEVAQLTTQRDLLAARLAAAKNSGDPRLLLDGKAAARQTQLEKAQQHLTAAQAAGTDVSIQATKLRLYAGLALWDAQAQSAENLYSLESGLATVDAQLAAVRTSWSSVSGQLASGQDIQQQRQRLNTLLVRLQAQQRQVNQALDAAKNQLRDQILVTLTGQRDRITQYLAQSRLAIARLLDQATGEKY